MSDPAKLPPPELEGAAEAPIIVFDEVPVYGIMSGMGAITLSAIIQDADGKGGVKQRHVVVAHLRGNGIAFETLRRAINGLEMLATPPQGGEKPN
jgi:hypothetical protein